MGYLFPFALIGYLFGSIPFGLLITKMAGAGDIRAIGSGNIGATNVLRTGRKGLAAATLLADALKGAVPVWIALFVFGITGLPLLFIAGGAFLGHLYPVWLRFKGGKGVATYVGLLLALSPTGFIAFAISWLLTALVSRFSSLAALVATLVAPVAIWFGAATPIALLFALMSVMCWWKHRENISRLASGTEGKIGGKG